MSDLIDFVLSQLPPPPARVLEVGCGEGDLAWALDAAGYEVVAVDPEAPDARIFRRTAIEAFDDPGPFDWRKEFGLNSRAMLHTVYFTHDKTTRPTRPACGIHGYFAVPTYPYSHCCFRVPLADALHIYRWTRIGERIHVYRS